MQPQAPAMQEKASGKGSSIIGILEVVLSDFTRSLSETEADEAAAADAYAQVTQQNKVRKVELQKDAEFAAKGAAGLDMYISATSSDLAGDQTQLDAVDAYLEQLNGMCVAKAETYAAR